MRKAADIVGKLTPTIKRSLAESLSREHRKELDDLVSLFISNPDAINAVGWQGIAKEYGPAWGRPLLSGATLIRNVEKLADAKEANSRKTARRSCGS